MKTHASLILFLLHSLHGQTVLDLRTQSKNVDFSQFPSTRPVKTGVVLPAACSIGALYFKIDNPPGQNLYGCSAPNTWTLEAGSPGSEGGTLLPNQSGPGYLMTNGSQSFWGNIPTGGSGALDCVSVPGQCDIVTSLVPLKPAANTWTGLNDFRSALLRLPEATIAPGINHLPSASSNTGREFMVTDGTSACDTSTGGGTVAVLVRSDGADYVAPNCAGGPTGPVQTSPTALTHVVYPLLSADGYQGSGVGSQTGFKGAISFAFTTQASMAVSSLVFNLVSASMTNCNGGAGPCGALFVISTTDPSDANPPSGSTVECKTETGYTGHATASKDISVIGVKSLSWVSGSAVSGAVCTLPAGGHVLTYLAENGGLLSSTNNVGAHWQTQGAIDPFYYGFASGVGSGTGASYTVPSLSTTQFTPGLGFDIPYLVVH